MGAEGARLSHSNSKSVFKVGEKGVRLTKVCCRPSEPHRGGRYTRWGEHQRRRLGSQQDPLPGLEREAIRSRVNSTN